MIGNFPVGDHVYAYLNLHGYLGFGEVVSAAVPIGENSSHVPSSL